MVGCITHKCNLQECQNTHKHCQSNVSRKRVVPNGTAQPQSLCIVMVTIVAQKLYWFERLLQRGTPQMNRKRHTLDNIPSTNNLLLLLLFFSGLGILICREEDICLDVFFQETGITRWFDSQNPFEPPGDACKPVKIVGYLSQYQVADLSPQNIFGNKLSAIDGTEKNRISRSVVSPGFGCLMFRGQIMPTLS